jgi:hypothetical protein
MMKIVYTVCSLNRLGQVKALAKTLRQHNPDYHFFACLADEINGRIDTEEYKDITFIPLSSVPVKNAKELTARYDIFELSCALKAYFGNYLMQQYNADVLLYFDTDICVYNSFLAIEEALKQNSILLTPHYSSPIPADGKYPLERDVLNSGLYNGGFIGMRNDETSRQFLQWWQDRLYDQAFNNVCEGMMVDQLWLNLVPLFFDSVNIFTNPGCNTAYWNLHERTLSEKESTVMLNNEPLIFFHFSGFSIDQPERLSTHQNRFRAKENSVLMKLVKDYRQLLKENDFETYLPMECVYGKKKEQKKHSFLKKKMIDILALTGYKLEKIRKLS